MIDGRRRAEKETAEDYVSGHSLSFQEEKDFIFAEVPVMEMMLALGAWLRSASPCRQVDVHEDKLPSVLPVQTFLSFPLLNLTISTSSSLSLAVIAVPHHVTTPGFHSSLSPCESQLSVLYSRCCGASSWGFCLEPQPSFAGCWWHPGPEAMAEPVPVCLGAAWWPQNGPKWPSCGAAQRWLLSSAAETGTSSTRS